MRSSRRKPDNFYRFIKSDDINQLSISIPKKFVRVHRKDILSNNVFIVVSDQNVWFLGWVTSGDGKICLQKGLPEFAEYYRLKSGYLLLFNHLGQSVFHVRIFNRSCCEINYSIFQEIEEPATEDDQTMAMAETEDLFAPTIVEYTKRKILTNPYKSPSGKGNKYKPKNRAPDSETEAFESPTIVEEIKAYGKGDEYRPRNRAPDSAKSFKSDYPFYSVKIKASYVNWGLYVPVPFLRRYLLYGDEKCGDCVLQVPNGRSWGPVKCRDYKNYGKLHGGNWNKFRDENHVGVGDVCVVELINEMEKVLKITIVRAR